jgi:hypothetical protein
LTGFPAWGGFTTLFPGLILRELAKVLLKEAIIWIHHGIELSLKQLLVQSNEYLVFENVDEAIRKLAHLRRQPDMSHATVLDLFDYGEGIYTVGIRKLIERVAIMLDLPDLAPGAFLRENIEELTNYRNKIVHFAVEVKLDEVVSLLVDLMEPFLKLLEQEIKNENFVQKCIPYVRANAESIFVVHRLKHAEIEERIVRIMKHFNGQQVSGQLFGVDGTITLPPFKKTESDLVNRDIRADIIAKNNSEIWLVEIKLFHLNSAQIHQAVNQFASYQEKAQEQIDNIKFWLIIMGKEKAFNKSGSLGSQGVDSRYGVRQENAGIH